MSGTEEDFVSIDEYVMRNSTSNTVEIRVTRENVVTLGSSTPPPFPTPHLLLNNIVSFERHKMYLLLCPTLQDPNLSDILSIKISSETKRVPGPLYISLHVTLKPNKFLETEEELETCAICLEEERDLSEMPNCSHVFHGYCINEWIRRSYYCPLCRALLIDDDDLLIDDED